jgi:parvulin-like peptidyl-prolyl isomerase
LAIFVNEQRIEEDTIRAEAVRLKERLRRELPDEDSLVIELQAREYARENVIRQVLLQQFAGQSSPDELVDAIRAKVARPKPKEIAAFYHQFSDLFHTPELIRAAHIVKNVDETASEAQAEAAIRQIEKELHAGSDFGELADKQSDCPGQGGDLGFFVPEEMVDEFVAALAPLRPGEISGVFRSPFGFHIAKLIERRSAGRRSLNDTRGEIEEELWNGKKDRAVREFIEQLRARAEIRKA